MVVDELVCYVGMARVMGRVGYHSNGHCFHSNGTGTFFKV